MRRLVLPLALACLTLTSATPAAPAPLPRRDREPASEKQRRLLQEHSRRLGALGVKWQVADSINGKVIRFNVQHPDGNSGMGGDFLVYNGNVPGTLSRYAKVFSHEQQAFPAKQANLGETTSAYLLREGHPARRSVPGTQGSLLARSPRRVSSPGVPGVQPMRLVAVTLAFALPSLAFAPAPFPQPAWRRADPSPWRGFGWGDTSFGSRRRS